MADNAARIACLFHVYQFGVTGRIEPETMASAVAVAAWYLNEAKRAFGELAEPEHLANARTLSGWLAAGAGGYVEDGAIRKNKILQHGPRPVRKKAERDEALELLADLNHIRHGKDERGAAVCSINPKLLSN
jgi:putative DNA primase/helicase